MLFAALLILIGYFLTHSYFVQLNIHKSKILSRLEAVATTASSQIDGNQLEYLLSTYTKKDEIETNNQVRVYELLNEKLAEIKRLNNLNTSIYTLTYHQEEKYFHFGVNSEVRPFYMHVYDHYPMELVDNYDVGGVVNVYEDKNGYWLSAFAPIKSSKGETIAVVVVDNRFDEFLEEAREEIFVNIGISLAFTLIIIFFLVRSIRTILLQEDKLNASLLQSKMDLEIKSKETLDSILYAKRIQEAILPLRSKIKKSIPDSFVFHLPRDIVSGDFYWFKKINNKIFIASVDCTGHGVPGAFMSMIGTILLDDIVEKKGIYEPDLILSELHQDVVKALKQDTREKASRDGMDIALCVLNEELSELSFAGAFRPLVHIRNGELKRIKSDSAPIGGFSSKRPTFTKHEIKLEKGDAIYIYSDGYADQFGGEKNKKYMTRKFRQLLQSISDLTMNEQVDLLEKEFNEWKGENEQVDDILVMGFRV
ncbi:MAG: SpoIIE family protein phosphatase [Flavobacteriales bacterium]|nr:SpoIIE family protein phosphatase [Flavobacteriales bacterium]